MPARFAETSVALIILITSYVARSAMSQGKKEASMPKELELRRMSHTLGPWKRMDSPSRSEYITSPRGIVAEAVIGYACSPEEAIPNAKLIAAAPDLLEALKNLCDAIEEGGGCDGNGDVFDLREVIAALVKAEGNVYA